MNINKTILTLAVLAAALPLGAVPASAPLDVTFAPVSTVFSGTTDQTVTFTGTFTNNYTYPLYINVGEPVGPDLPLTLDDSAFQNTFPVAPNPIAVGGTVTADFFTITVPAGTPTGGFDGTFDLFGGQDPTDILDPLSYTKFHVDVQAVPEASTPVSFGLLVMLGIGSLAVRARRKA